MSKIISRADALEQGLKFYFSGKQCKRGHVAERYVSSRNCCECLQEDRVKELRARNYLENKETILEKHKHYKEENKESKRASDARYRDENRAAINERCALYRANNKDALREREVRRWAAKKAAITNK
jgi:hypothetical protein